MCVAVPGTVVSIGSPMPGAVMGCVAFGGRTLEINLIMVPDLEVGDQCWCIPVTRYASSQTKLLLTPRGRFGWIRPKACAEVCR